MSEPTTEAGRALWFDMTANSGGEALHPLWVEHLRGRIVAIEREAIAAFLASPEAAEGLARALRGMKPCGDPDCPDRHFGWCDNEVAAILAALRETT